MKVCVLVPVLGRPHRVAPLLDSIRRASRGDVDVLFVCSPGDDAEIAAVGAAGAEPLIVGEPPGPGDYARKINAGYRATAAPLLFLAADDLSFHVGWDERAVSRLGSAVEVVGTNDLGNPRVMNGEHSTHTLVTRHYCDAFGTIDEPGAVLHEGYDHNYCDDEFVRTAKARGAFAFAADSIVEHLHPNWGKGDDDATYERGREGFEHDRRLFQRRRSLWDRGPGGRRRRVVAERQATPRTPDVARLDVTVITASVPERAALLQEAVASVAAQTRPAAHLIGVDSSRTAGQVRNALVAAARTEWVAFLDDDDLLDADHLATLLDEATGADVVIPHCRFEGPPLPPDYCNRSFDQRDLVRHGIFPVTVIARRRAVLDAGGYAETGWDDWELWKRMARRGSRFRVVPKVTWTYRTATPDRRTDRVKAGGA